SMLRTAIDLGMFDAMAGGGKTASEISQTCKMDLKAAEIFLNAFVGLEVLVKNDSDVYSLTNESELYLLSDSQLFLGTYFTIQPSLAEPWRNLTEIARTGVPFAKVDSDEKAKEFFPQLAKALFSMNFAYAKMLSQELKTGAGLRVLDLACGSAVWSIPLALANENNKVDALDFPPVLDIAREFVEKNKVSGQYKYLAGNWRDIELEKDAYDVVILGHILHSEGKTVSEKLLATVYDALKEGGKIVVAEFLTDDSRCFPNYASMFAVNMFILTSEGCVFTHNELDQMLKDTGFSGIRRVTHEPYEASVIVAKK
ncbi:MAG: class I SAM-dependent methyltransferase, partial [Cyanobacteria bacterium]|nr:class I SAM-dependent methyltransferase [Cyanobacteriota bacterium]